MSRRLLPVLALAAALPACTSDDPFNVVIGPYEATIRRDTWGIPHIVADDAPSLYYATGYAYAEDHVCTLADQFVKVRSERARYFGPGPDDAHIKSDVAWKIIGVMADAEAIWLDLEEDKRDALVAYTAGYNDYLAEVGPGGLPAPCRDAAWVQPIDHIDLLAFYLNLGQFGSGYNLLDFIATAQPPGADRRVAPPSLDSFRQAIEPRGGSNGIGLGRSLTTSGAGMVLSNSHFEAEGERRWWEMHQTIPGELDVYGVSLTGVMVVNMGINEHVAWTHTVSTSPRFIIYQLELDSSNPTRYRYDGSWREMEQGEVSIQVLQDDGSLSTYTQTTWRTHYGPMLNAPIVGWGPSVGFTYRDVNVRNSHMIQAWWDINRATSLDELREAQSTGGIPWVHTVAASRDGEAYYADAAATPNLPDSALAAWEDYVAGDFLARQFRGEGAYVMDGGDPAFEWVDEGTPQPFIVPADRHPRLRTERLTANSNENFWLTSHEEPIEGVPDIYGEERAPRRGRTKATLAFADGSHPLVDPGEDGTWTLAELEAAMMRYPAHYVHTVKDALVERCTGAGPVTVRWDGLDTEVDVSEACAVLSAWDGGYDVDARGAHVFREWLASGEFDLGGLSTFVDAGDFDDEGVVFSDAFDPADPLNTPRVVRPAPEGEPDPFLTALAEAVLMLRSVDIALDARLGDIQFRDKLGTRTPCPGGKELEGSMFIADYRTGNSTLLPREHAARGEWVNPRSELTADGYPITGGDSWVSALTWEDGRPTGRAVLIYGQSADPESPHALDQAPLHGAGELRDILFAEEDVLADPNLVETELSRGRERYRGREE